MHRGHGADTGGGTCRYCGGKLPRGSASAACASGPCQVRMQADGFHAASARAAREAEARRQRDLDRVRPLLEAAARRAGAGDAAGAVTAIVPHTSAPIGPFDPAQRERFLDHLRAIVAEAFAGPDAAPDRPDAAPPDPDRLARREAQEPADPDAVAIACIACRGRCCMLGRATHGFTTPALIALYRHRHPQATAEEVTDAYAAHLPDEATEGGCVYQGAKGCTLPRAMRADICNDYRCGPLAGLTAAVAARPGAPAVAIGLRADHAGVPEGGPRLGRTVSFRPGRGIALHPDLTVPPLSGDPPGRG